MKKILIALGVILVLVVVAGAIAGGGGNGGSGGSNDENLLTLEKYNQVQNGMTYEEVIKIVGFEGTPEAEVGEKGTALYTVSYRYMGNDQVKGSMGANASFMFQGGKLNMKAQTGLK